MRTGSETLESRMMRKYQVRFGGGWMEKAAAGFPSQDGPTNPGIRRHLASRLPNYTPGENSVLCKLTVRMPDGSTLTKADAGGYAGMPDQGDDDKSGFSDAFKRAAVKIGVGRYLYRDGVPTFVKEREPVLAQAPAVEPAQVAEPSPAPASHARSSTGNGQGSAPRSGRALFAWTKEQEQRHEVGLLKYLNGWAKLQEFPGRMVDWDADQVNQAYSEAVRKLQSISNGHAEAYEETLAN
jgi:hypothetical protein